MVTGHGNINGRLVFVFSQVSFCGRAMQADGVRKMSSVRICPVVTCLARYNRCTRMNFLRHDVTPN